MNRTREQARENTEIAASVLIRARNADGNAFREIVDHYGKRVFAAAWRVKGDTETAQDVVQDVFLRFHTALISGDDIACPGAWLHRVAVNAAIDRRRSQLSHARIALDSLPDPPADAAERPDTVTEGREVAMIIRDLVTELPRRQGEVFVMRDIDGAPVAEIARMLGCAEKTVRVHLARARLALRTMLTKRYPYLMPTRGEKQ